MSGSAAALSGRVACVEPQADAPDEALDAAAAVPDGLRAMLRSAAATPEERAHLETAAAAELLVAQVVGSEILRVAARDAAASPLVRDVIERSLAQVRNACNPALASPEMRLARQSLERLAARVDEARLRVWAPFETDREN